jgi:hypothetical protein
MKISVDVDLTPEELRRFFGLPDVEPLNREMIESVRRNMAAGMDGFDPASLLKPWLPPHLQSLDSMQRNFWEAFTRAGRAGEEGK